MKNNLLFLLTIIFVFSCKKTLEETPEGPPVKTTLGGKPGAGVTDADLNKYPTVVFTNGQEWMAENLRTTRFSNSEKITQIQSSVEWAKATGSAFSRTHNLGFKYPLNYYYDTLFGPVYNFYAASDSRGLCPTGWRVPSDEDWKKLEKHLGMSDALLSNKGWRGDMSMNLADKLMAVSDKYNYLPVWEGIGGTNSSGFNAMSAGWLGQDGLYNAEFSQTYFWSQTNDETSDLGWQRGLDAGQLGVERNLSKPQLGYSVRCIKGEGSRALLDKISLTKDVEWVRVHPSYYTISLTTSVLSNGNSEVTEVGYCWGTNPNPTKNVDSTRIITSSINKYDITINSLQPDKLYYFRAYVKNAFGISYGATTSFYTGPYSSMIDQENNVYKIKQIGSQIWMCENLKTTTKNNGTSFLMTTDPSVWSSSNKVSGDIIFKSQENIYYTNYTAILGEVCPIGWHVPSISEFERLLGFAGNADALMNKGTIDWNAPNSTASNNTGFTAQGLGYIDNTGNIVNLKNKGYFWSTSYDYVDTGGPLELYPNVLIFNSNPSSTNTGYTLMQKYYGASIRCVKN